MLRYRSVPLFGYISISVVSKEENNISYQDWAGEVGTRVLM